MSALDVATLKATVGLLPLLERDTRLKKVAGTRGGEWAGPCPFCGGLDRFHVQPEQGIWMCRACQDGRWQDAIAYVMRRDNCDFLDACRALGARDLDRPTGRLRSSSSYLPLSVREDEEDHSDLQPTLEQPPSPAWQARGLELVAECERVLWTSTGERALAWLRERGLGDATIRAARLGFQRRDKRFEPASRWGLPEQDKKVWLPPGITVPWLTSGVLWQLKVRTPAGKPKYPAVRGGHPLLYGLDDLQGRGTLVLTEGEFDALLLRQQAGDLGDVLTLGSCAALPGGRALAWLAGYRRVLVAYDADPPGDTGASKVLALVANGRRLRPTVTKDITDMHKAGWDLRAWVSFALAGQERGQARPALVALPPPAAPTPSSNAGRRRLVNDEAVPLRVVLTDGHVAVLAPGGFVRVPPGVDVREAARVEQVA